MEYWKRVFIENFTYEELYKLFKNDMNEEDLQYILEEMCHDFKEVKE